MVLGHLGKKWKGALHYFCGCPEARIQGARGILLSAPLAGHCLGRRVVTCYFGFPPLGGGNCKLAFVAKPPTPGPGGQGQPSQSPKPLSPACQCPALSLG